MKEYKAKSVEDLTKLLDEKREFVRAARFGKSGSAKKSVKDIMLAKKEIARILTEQNSRATVGNNVTA